MKTSDIKRMLADPNLPSHNRYAIEKSMGIRAKQNVEINALFGIPKDWRFQGVSNKLELAFAYHLEGRKLRGEIDEWYCNSIRFKLASGAWYKPDFLVVQDRKIVLYETKGFWREAARVRIKVATSLYPWFKFTAVQKVGGQFQYEEFKP